MARAILWPAALAPLAPAPAVELLQNILAVAHANRGLPDGLTILRLPTKLALVGDASHSSELQHLKGALLIP